MMVYDLLIAVQGEHYDTISSEGSTNKITKYLPKLEMVSNDQIIK